MSDKSNTSKIKKEEGGIDKSPKTHGNPPPPPAIPAQEIGGRGGLDPVRYGDWEIGGKCVDF